jgi:2-dehydro-3-deoxyphosphogluconate aldolase/(4S)-4-hydroxy-2-oxoglutarate aldolase
MQKKLTHKRIVPVAVIDSLADAVPLARALESAGLPLIEVTLRTPCALDCITAIRAECPKVTVGAGTVLNPAQLEAAIGAGAQFGVAPGFNKEVVLAATENKLFFIPGVMTPSDIEAALMVGCKLLKFFPADSAGGLKMLKALSGPYEPAGVRFIPLGGISAANMSEYLAMPAVAAVGGSWLCERKLVKEKKWAEITALAKEALSKVPVAPK